MSISPPPPPPPPPGDANELQFETAEPAAASEQPTAQAVTCGACGRPIVDAYYAAGDTVICGACREAYLASRTGGSRTGRLLKAALFGVGAGLVGAAIWYGVRRVTGYEIGLIAIVVGLMVGGAVRAGSQRRGGLAYQILAVVLTYFSICANYMPDVFFALRSQYYKDQHASAFDDPTTRPATAFSSAPGADGEIAKGADTQARPSSPTAGGTGEGEPGVARTILGLMLLLVLVFFVSLSAPFLGGASNIIGILIIAFALWEAWKINKRQDLTLSGPHALPAAAGAGAA